MRRLGLAALLICVASSVWAAAGPLRFTMQPPGWVNRAAPGAQVVMDWAGGRFWVRGAGLQSPYSLVSLSRASSGYAQTAGGLLINYSNSNQLRYNDQGVLIEESRTNDALWSRDLTNVVWITVNTTTAHTAVGADGAANSATTLTATAGNGTILQSITLGSTADTSSVYLKCVTCTGAIQITENNGSTWTACSGLVTTAFVRCSVTAALANPIIGLRIVNSGDSVVADFFQMEPGGFVTSPISTTSATVTRSADAVSPLGALGVAPAMGAIFASYTPVIITNNTTNRQELWVNNELANARLSVRGGDNGGSPPTFIVGNGTSNSTITAGPFSAGTLVKTATGWDVTGASVAANGTQATTATAWSQQSGGIFLGNSATGTSQIDAIIGSFSLFIYKPNDAILKAMTQ